MSNNTIVIDWDQVDGYRLWETTAIRLGGLRIESHRSLDPYGMVDDARERYSRSNAARGAAIGEKSPKWRLYSSPFGLMKGYPTPYEFDTEEEAIQALERELGICQDYRDILLLSPRQ